MGNIALITDSTAYIPAELVKKYNITVTPQILIWGEETYQDGIDIQPSEFYEKLQTAKVMPTTSQVAIGTMQTLFQKLVDQGNEVLGIFISSKLSGTIQSATQGREGMSSGKEKVQVVDSNSTAMAMGFHVLTVARALADGASMKDAVQLAEKARDHTGVYFAVDTLEFLHRGGRIGGAQRFLGAALNMKPILAIQDGRVEAVERVRTKGKALDRVIELVAEQTAGKGNVRLATLHANAESEAKDVLTRAAAQLNPVEQVLASVSPVIGTHAGPGTVGLAFMAGM